MAPVLAAWNFSKGGLSVVEGRVVEGRVVGFGNPHVKGLEIIETQLQCLNRRVCEYIL